MRALSISLLLLSSLGLAAEPTPRVAVLDLRAAPDATSLASAVSGVIANELQRLGVFEVSTAEQVRALISVERQKAMLGVAEDGDGFGKLGEALAADYLVNGELMRLKGQGGASTLSLQLVLLDGKSGQRVGSELLNAKTEGELVASVGATTLKLCGKALAGRTGTLYVEASEVGARVSVDGDLKGVTPLPGRLELSGGPHLLEVHKEGFVTLEKQVRVKPGEHVEETARLVPSPDFIQAYESRATTLRTGAYLATGLAVVGVASATYFQVNAMRLFGAPDQSGTFAYHQALVNEGVEAEDSVNHRAEATRLKTEIHSAQKFVTISGGVGAAAAVTATVLFLIGDPPGRYSRYEVLGGEPSVTLVPGGALGAYGFQF